MIEDVNPQQRARFMVTWTEATPQQPSDGMLALSLTPPNGVTAQPSDQGQRRETTSAPLNRQQPDEPAPVALIQGHQHSIDRSMLCCRLTVRMQLTIRTAARMHPTALQFAHLGSASFRQSEAKLSTNWSTYFRSKSELDAWLDAHPLDTVIVVGDCTDICVFLLALHLRTRANARNQSLRIIVPAHCVDTYDLPIETARQVGALPHDGELYCSERIETKGPRN
ncbi:MAG: isochorismatase family protein [Chloroflexi bacterium]|nr:isochorismatase family protein [Chloroflexota bacterium]